MATINITGFVSDARRLNVAMTRAKRGMIVVGTRKTLQESTSLWRTWDQWTTEEGVQTDETEVLPAGHNEKWKIWTDWMTWTANQGNRG